MDNKDDLKNIFGAHDAINVDMQRIEIELGKFGKKPDCEALPILPTRNLVMFPGITVTFELGRASSLTTATVANEEGTPIGIICQMDPDED